MPILLEESLTMLVRLLKYRHRGLTSIAMLGTIAVAGIVRGIATPALMLLNKPDRSSHQG